jgi:hypothetical protein
MATYSILRCIDPLLRERSHHEQVDRTTFMAGMTITIRGMVVMVVMARITAIPLKTTLLCLTTLWTETLSPATVTLIRADDHTIQRMRNVLFSCATYRTELLMQTSPMWLEEVCCWISIYGATIDVQLCHFLRRNLLSLSSIMWSGTIFISVGKGLVLLAYNHWWVLMILGWDTMERTPIHTSRTWYILYVSYQSEPSLAFYLSATFHSGTISWIPISYWLRTSCQQGSNRRHQESRYTQCHFQAHGRIHSQWFRAHPQLDRNRSHLQRSKCSYKHQLRPQRHVCTHVHDVSIAIPLYSWLAADSMKVTNDLQRIQDRLGCRRVCRSNPEEPSSISHRKRPAKEENSAGESIRTPRHGWHGWQWSGKWPWHRRHSQLPPLLSCKIGRCLCLIFCFIKASLEISDSTK